MVNSLQKAKTTREDQKVNNIKISSDGVVPKDESMFYVYYLESIADFDELRIQNKKYLRMEHYLEQAKEEIKIEIEEENERKERKRLNKLRKANSKRIEKEKETENRKKKREGTDCAKDFEFDFQVLRTTFSHDTEGEI